MFLVSITRVHGSTKLFEADGNAIGNVSRPIGDGCHPFAQRRPKPPTSSHGCPRDCAMSSRSQAVL